MKEIQLTKGFVAMVDDTDYQWLNQYKWYTYKSTNGNLYAQTWISGTKRGYKTKMHRLILELVNPKIYVDHKDGNGLNNQRENLRVATNSQNQANRKGKYRYNGVSLKKMKSKNGTIYKLWYAQLKKDGKVYGKSCRTEIEAAEWYNKMAIKYHGEFANLNIIPEKENRFGIFL